MHKKKKNVNKQNYKTNKIIPLTTVPSFNTTQQVRIPTLSSYQLKNMVKSIELKKNVITNPYKKLQSKKSTCKNGRVHTINYPIKNKSIMLESKQLKNICQKSHSNSKSPISRKSKSSKKYLTKKSIVPFQINPHSKTSLNFKLKKTIKQLEGNTFETDEDSLLPIKTSSDIIPNLDIDQAMVSPLAQDFIDINELRKYCLIKADKNNIEFSRKHFNQFKEHRAALKIQRAWKRYRTKRLVSRYVFLSHFQEEKDIPRREIVQINDQQSLNFQQFSPFEEKQRIHNIIMIPPLQIKNKLNKDVEMHPKKQYEETINRLKNEQVQKWDKIIQMISLNKNKNPQQLEKMLQILTEQSKSNKKKLQAIKPIKIPKDVYFQAKDQQKQILSVNPSPFEQFNSQKYIQFLDGDLYFKDKSKFSISEQPQKMTISKRKQQILLQSLAPKSSRRIGQEGVSQCESMKALHKSSNQQNKSLKPLLQKSNSQKILMASISSMKSKIVQEIEEPSQINLDLLTKEFMEGSNFCSENFDMFYSQEKLRSKLAELNKMKEQENQQSFSDQQNITFRSNQDQLDYEEDYLTSKEETCEDKIQLRRSNQFFQLHIPKNNDQIKIQQQQKIQSQQSLPDPDDARNDACCVIIQNSLLIEVFQDIAKSKKIIQALKSVFITSEVIPTKKKKGFPTSKAEIFKFLQDIVRYLNTNQPSVFKNLQIPTGPSAFQMLRFMHNEQNQELSDNTDDGDEANVMVIPNRIFDTMWQMKEQSITVTVPQHLDQQDANIFKYQLDVLKNLNKIFYRCMFDTFNQCLDCLRNYGLYGKPFPWKRVPSFSHQNSEEQLKQKLEKARSKMMQISITYCGLIIEKEEMVNQINEQYIKQVHQDRLSRMLANDLFQSQQRWVFYDDEETEILVEISTIICLQIVKDAIWQITNI